MGSHLGKTLSISRQVSLCKVKAYPPTTHPTPRPLLGICPSVFQELHLYCPMADLQHVVQSQVAKALPGEGEGTRGLLYFMGPVPWCLGIPH